MRFIDEVNITIRSGNGGDGCVSFRREKFVPRGGPDGGDGGNGGDIYFQGHEGLNTLVNFRGRKNYKAENGEPGGGSCRNGKTGEDLVIRVPVGTLVRHAESGEILADITDNETKVLLAEGGMGGLGNINFKSATNQVPSRATPGKEGVSIDVELELKLLADIALVGMPNAGKSTLISVLSAAKPKIADYPFTTLEPNLGVVKVGDQQSLVIADIPGLIEDASEGKGLGIKFLKHIERTKAFIHLVDVSWCLDEFEAFEQYVVIREELGKYKEELLNKKELVCLTKIDAMTDEEIEKYKTFFEEQLDKKVLTISAVSGDSMDNLKGLLFRLIQE